MQISTEATPGSCYPLRQCTMSPCNTVGNSTTIQCISFELLHASRKSCTNLDAISAQHNSNEQCVIRKGRKLTRAEQVYSSQGNCAPQLDLSHIISYQRIYQRCDYITKLLHWQWFSTILNVPLPFSMCRTAELTTPVQSLPTRQIRTGAGLICPPKI